jgi:hypothetical protein
MFGPIAKAQCGLITLEQARIAGMTRDQCQSLIDLGHWGRIGYGVYQVVGTKPSWQQNAWLACLETGGVASHRTAAYLHRLDGIPSWPPKQIEILLNHDNRRLSDGALVRRSRSLRPDHIFKGDGIPRTNLARTLIDLADVLGPKPFGEAFDSALRNVSDLRQWVGRLLADMPRGRRHPGRGLLDRLVSSNERAVDSALEVKLRSLLREHGFASPITGYETADDNGYMVKLDFAWPLHKPRIALMAHGYGVHSKRPKWNRDLDQSSGLSVLGWIVIQCSYDDVVNHPDKLVARLRRAFAI